LKYVLEQMPTDRETIAEFIRAGGEISDMPDELRPGLRALVDAALRGRRVRGRPKVFATVARAEAIARYVADGNSQAKAARKFKVNKRTVERIIEVQRAAGIPKADWGMEVDIKRAVDAWGLKRVLPKKP
jgi:hypothetical protein